MNKTNTDKVTVAEVEATLAIMMEAGDVERTYCKKEKDYLYKLTSKGLIKTKNKARAKKAWETRRAKNEKPVDKIMIKAKNRKSSKNLSNRAQKAWVTRKAKNKNTQNTKEQVYRIIFFTI